MPSASHTRVRIYAVFFTFFGLLGQTCQCSHSFGGSIDKDLQMPDPSLQTEPHASVVGRVSPYSVPGYMPQYDGTGRYGEYNFGMDDDYMDRVVRSDMVPTLPPSPQTIQQLQQMEQYDIYHSGLAACEKEALWGKSLELLDRMQKRNIPTSIRSWNYVLGALVRAGQWERALEAKNRMFEVGGVYPTHHAFLLVLRALANAPPAETVWPKALAIVQEMKTRHVNPDVATYAAALQVVRHHGQEVQESFLMEELFELFKTTLQNLEMYYPSGRAGTRALELIVQMQERRVRPTLAMMNVAVISCARQYTWNRVLDVISAVRTKWVKGNHITYNAALAATRKGVRWECAAMLLDWMREDGVEADQNTINIALGIYREAIPTEPLDDMDTFDNVEGIADIVGRYSEAFQFVVDKHYDTAEYPRWRKSIRLMQRMQSKGLGLTRDMFIQLADECKRSDQWQLYLSVLATMTKRDFYIGEEHYNDGLRLLQRHGQWELGLKLLRQMHRDGMEPGYVTDAIILEMLAQEHRWEKFIQLIRSRLVNTMTFQLPNGRYNIFSLEENGRDGLTGAAEEEVDILEQPLQRVARGTYRLGGFDFTVVGLNIPGDGLELEERVPPQSSTYNNTIDTGFTTARSSVPGKKVLGLFNESQFFREALLIQPPNIVEEFQRRKLEREARDRKRMEELQAAMDAAGGSEAAPQQKPHSDDASFKEATEVVSGGGMNRDAVDSHPFGKRPMEGDPPPNVQPYGIGGEGEVSGEIIKEQRTSTLWDQTPADIDMPPRPPIHNHS